MDDEQKMMTFKGVDGMGAFVTKQAEDILIIQNHISDAVEKAELAIIASNRAADMNVGFFSTEKT